MQTHTWQHVNGHIGRRTLRTAQHRDPEFEAVITSQNLVVLNSWGSSASGHCHTFQQSMIDLIALRRPAADARSRSAKAEPFDLAPWRQGPKHKAVTANIPFRAGWLYGARKPVKQPFSLRCLRQSLKAGDARSRTLSEHVLGVLWSDAQPDSLEHINALLLKKCKQLYPTLKTPTCKPSTRPEVARHVHDMWGAHRLLRQGRPQNNAA